MSDFRPRLRGKKKKAFENLMTDERRILVVGDLHAPFTLDGYLEHCIDVYEKYNLNQVVFIGDIIDNHYASYHETDPNGYSGGDELQRAIEAIKPWAEAFPDADVTIGNHDRMIMRKAFSSAIPKEWIKDYNEVLGTNWRWVEEVVYDGVVYQHGEGGSARTSARNDMVSTVQGHIHTQCYTEWFVGKNYRVFAMQVGCGIDRDSFAAAYAKKFKKQAIACGVVLGGHTAINVPMNL